MTRQVQIVSETVNAPAARVYDFARQRENLHRWATGLASADIKPEGDHWAADSPMGRIQIRMTPKNDFGVLDHDVTTPDGTTTHNAFRVSPVGEGVSVLTFAVLRQKGADDAAFEKDAAHVAKDLKALKALMETKGD
jgi:hypothetical protein